MNTDEYFQLIYNSENNQVDLYTIFGSEMTCFTSLNKDEVEKIIAFLNECLIIID